MRDPFLQAHQIGPRLFSVGGKLFPVSIRDQMIRGQFFVDRALDLPILETAALNDHPVLIVGAGVAGISATIRALERGIPVVLVEKHDQPLCVQAACQHRWISPTLYDFPVDHWAIEQFPSPPPATMPPLAWKANWAHKLTLAWRGAFSRVTRQHKPLFTPCYNSRLEMNALQLDGSGRFLHASVVPTDPQSGRQPKSYQPAIVLLAIGFGDEKRYLRPPNAPRHPTWGYHFWEKDPYTEQNMRLPSGQQPEVLISGSGDGALQDFLRIVTGGKRTKEIYKSAPLQQSALLALQSAVDRGQRLFSWGRNSGHDHAGLEQLHDEIRDIAETAYNRGGTVIQNRLEKLVRRPVPTIRLLYECTHFSTCYGLNRFLGLLMVKHLEKTGSPLFLMDQRRLKDITSADSHQCLNNPDGCHGMNHEVTWEELPDCRQPPTGVTGKFSANVLVIRHGIDLGDYPYDPTPPQFRQLLPVNLP